MAFFKIASEKKQKFLSKKLTVLDRLKTRAFFFKKRQKKKYKKQKRYSLIYKTLKIFNNFYARTGKPEFRRKWRIRKPFFLLAFYLRRYIKRYYGRLRNPKMDAIYYTAKKQGLKAGYSFFNYFATLESLLPVFLTRLGVFRNPMVAKSAIKKGLVFINGFRQQNFNYILQQNDMVQLDTSLTKTFKNIPFYDHRIKLLAYIYRKRKVPRRYKYKWYVKARNFRRFLFYIKIFYLLQTYWSETLLFCQEKNIIFDKTQVLKVLAHVLIRKICFFNLLVLRYKKKMNRIKVKSKFMYRIKRHRFRQKGRFYRRTLKPYAKFMAAGFPYGFRLRVNRFLLHVEYSVKMNTFIYIKPPIWANLNMYLLNTHWSDKKRFSNSVYKDMFVFLLDNYKQSLV